MSERFAQPTDNRWIKFALVFGAMILGCGGTATGMALTKVNSEHAIEVSKWKQRGCDVVGEKQNIYTAIGGMTWGTNTLYPNSPSSVWGIRTITIFNCNFPSADISTVETITYFEPTRVLNGDSLTFNTKTYRK